MLRVGRVGATLLEVVVVVALVAILGATAVLNRAALRDALALREGAAQVAGDLRAARLRALGAGRAQRLVFVAGEGSYRAQEETADGYLDVGGERALPAGVAVVGCNGDDGSIAFRPRGHAASFGTVTVRNRAGVVRRIVVNIAGRVRVA